MVLHSVEVDENIALDVMFFVQRAEGKGVPRRVAIQRAVKRFKLPNTVIRDILRRS